MHRPFPTKFGHAGEDSAKAASKQVRDDPSGAVSKRLSDDFDATPSGSAGNCQCGPKRRRLSPRSPPSARQGQDHTPNIFPLKALPDDILVHVFAKLCKSDGESPLRCRGLRAAANAFSLAMCCQRLLRIFRTSCLSRVDGAHAPPEDEELLSRSVMCRSSVQHPRHLNTVAWLAGATLRELRLPPYGGILFSARHVLTAVANYCPKVETLSLPDSVDNPPELMKMLFSHLGPRLKSLSITAPRPATVRALINCEGSSLENLALLDVPSEAAGTLCSYLRRKGSTLKSFKVRFCDITSFPYAILQSYFEKPTCTLLSFLNEELKVFCSNIESLDIGISEPLKSSFRPHAQADIGFPHLTADEINSFVSEHDEGVGRMASNLKRIRIGAPAEFIVGQFKTIPNLIGRNTRLEAEFPGASIVFPTYKHGGRAPYFRGVGLGLLPVFPHLPVIDPSAYCGLEWISVGDIVSTRYYRSAPSDYYTALHLFCLAARETLTTVQVWPKLHCTPEDGEGCAGLAFMQDLLRLCPNVRSLQVSRSLIADAVADPTMAERVGQILRNIEKLHLCNEHLDGRLWFIDEEESAPAGRALLEALPAFLKLLAEHCQNLKRVYLDKLGELSSIYSRQRMRIARTNVRIALLAVDDFEMIRPNVDVGTVRAQLVQWRNQCG